MSGTKQLDIIRCKRSSTFRKWDDVVKVQLVSCVTNYASTAVAFPYFKFHRGWYNPSPVFRKPVHLSKLCRRFLYCDQFEFKNSAISIMLSP